MEKNIKTLDVKTVGKNKGKESEYTIQEFVRNSECLFDIPSECVKVALLMECIESTTLSCAKEIVKKFMRKEVR